MSRTQPDMSESKAPTSPQNKPGQPVSSVGLVVEPPETPLQKWQRECLERVSDPARQWSRAAPAPPKAAEAPERPPDEASATGSRTNNVGPPPETAKTAESQTDFPPPPMFPFPPPTGKVHTPPASECGDSGDYDEYMRNREDECDIPLDAPLQPGPATNRVRRFVSWLDSWASKDKVEFISLSMWHSRYEQRLKKGHNLVAPCVPSEFYPEVKWKVFRDRHGGTWVEEVDINVVHPAMGGPSNDASYAYDCEENRPRKRFALSSFMDVKALCYVDMELYAHLKGFGMASGTVAGTQQKLYREAKTFMSKYRIDDTHPIFILEVIQWTVLAAMLPTEGELLGMKMVSRSGIYQPMAALAEFRRTGTVRKRRWWGLLPDRVLTMFKPPPS